MPNIRVLIADDETLMRRLLAQQLALEEGFDVVGEAADGREAVELALQLRPDVVIMDLSMPHLNGAEATERIVARHPHIKVILLTALRELAPVGKSSGAFECLNKGCTPQELITTVRRASAAKSAPPAKPPPPHYRDAIERLVHRHGLSDYEQAVLTKAVLTPWTMKEIAAALTAEMDKPVTEASVRHALERIMTRLRLQPRARAALVKRVLEEQV